jgi:hypothetical protein
MPFLVSVPLAAVEVSGSLQLLAAQTRSQSSSGPDLTTLACCWLPVGLVLLFVVTRFSGNNSKRVTPPDRLKQELTKQAAASRTDKVDQLLSELPNWSIRTQLTRTARELAELKRGLAYASQRPDQHSIAALRSSIAENEALVWGIASRVAAVAAQSGIGRQEKLPHEVRTRLDADMRQLDLVAKAALVARESLTIWLAQGDGIVTADTEMKLKAIALSMRDLAQTQDA